MSAAMALCCASATARAQTTGNTVLPNATTSPAPNPRVVPGLAAPPPSITAIEDTGLLAPYATPLAADGISFHANFFDFFNADPSFGLQQGHTSNSGYLLTGADLDLGKLFGIAGGFVHVEETIFNLRDNNKDAAAQFGDSSLGYQTTYNLRAEELSTLTYEQQLFHDTLDIELGRTHPDRYFALPTCRTLNTCYNDILNFNAGYVSPLYSVWGGRASLALSKFAYVEAGSFTLNPDANAESGWDWGQESNPGALTMAEIGRRSTFADERYPTRLELTFFYNSGSHDDNDVTTLGRPRGFYPDDPVKSVDGTSGIVFNGEQIVWRADHGRVDTPTPTALALYEGWGYGFDPSEPYRSDLYVGANLLAPFRSRPNDHVGIKLRWEHLNRSFTQYEAQANREAGGSGDPFSQDKEIIELNGHFLLVAGIALEPQLQYIFNPDSAYDVETARRPSDGLYAGASLEVPIGAILGLKPL